MRYFFSYIIFYVSFLCTASNNSSFPFSVEDGLILFNVMIGNSNQTFLFDTGAPNSIFIENIVDTISYKILKRTFIIDGFGNKKPAWLTQIKEITIGNKKIKDEYFVLIESNPIIKIKNIKGIIGFNTINKLDWKFDFSNNTAEVKNKLKIKNTSNYKIFNTFILKNHLYTTLSIDDERYKDTCLIDFGDNQFISINYYSKDKKNYDYIYVHSVLTAITQKVDTSYIYIKKINFNDQFCLDRFPLFTNEKNYYENTIGCSFFAMFEEIIIQNSCSRILLKNKDDLNINLEKYKCYFKDNILTSFILKKNEPYHINIGDNVIQKKINTSEKINFKVNMCQ